MKRILQRGRCSGLYERNVIQPTLKGQSLEKTPLIET